MVRVCSSVLEKKEKTGTREWADTNLNIISGCRNDCLYCYSKSMAVRFHRATPESWKNESLNKSFSTLRSLRKAGTIMFPSSHDLSAEFLPQILETLSAFLMAGNQILIVSKPRLVVIQTLVRELVAYREQVTFRFTIGSKVDDILHFWEPGASGFDERYQSLHWANLAGFKTSVSIEPMLDMETYGLVTSLSPYVTGEIWIGLMNKVKQRLARNGYQGNWNNAYFNLIHESYSIDYLTELKSDLGLRENIRWKDSIRRRLGFS